MTAKMAASFLRASSWTRSSALVAGKRRVDKLVSWGGSALTGDNYANVLLLSDQVTNEQRGWGDATAMHEARGTSRGLAGHFAKGKSPPLATQTDLWQWYSTMVTGQKTVSA